MSPITRLALYGIAAILLSQATLLNSYIASQINQLPILGQRTCTSSPSSCPPPVDTTPQLAEVLKNLSPIYVPIKKQPPSLATASNIDPNFETQAPDPSTTLSPTSTTLTLPETPPDLQLQATFTSSNKTAIINNTTYSLNDTIFTLNNTPWILSNITPSSATISPQQNHTPKKTGITLFIN